jgi:predicted TIM-barrel fold metal-dependent hydrolase
MPTAGRVHDCLINVHFGDAEQPDWMFRVKDEYFKRDDSIFGTWEMQEVLDEMDANGVERAIVTGNVNDRTSSPIRFVEARPDRFALAAGGLNLLRPMPSLRLLQSFAADYPVAYASAGPAFWGDGMYTPENAVYYPLYTKCCELDLPLCMNAGLPGPPIPGEAQNPIYLDRVCVRFPELKLCMIHGADPWWDTAIRLMIKYPNLHLMTWRGPRSTSRKACCTSCGPAARRR